MYQCSEIEIGSVVKTKCKPPSKRLSSKVKLMAPQKLQGQIKKLVLLLDCETQAVDARLFARIFECADVVISCKKVRPLEMYSNERI